MHSSKIILSIAALAGSALSQKSDAAFCSTELNSFFSLIFNNAPATPDAILSAIATRTDIPVLGTASLDPKGHQSQLCAIASALPQSLLPEFQSFAGEIFEFGRSYSDDFIAFATNCAEPEKVAASTSYLSYIFTATGNLCEETATVTPAPGSGTNGTYPTATPTITSSIPTAGAPKATGALLMAAGGVLGAAAML